MIENPDKITPATRSALTWVEGLAYRLAEEGWVVVDAYIERPIVKVERYDADTVYTDAGDEIIIRLTMGK